MRHPLRFCAEDHHGGVFILRSLNFIIGGGGFATRALPSSVLAAISATAGVVLGGAVL